ncbi:hypothetical protein [Sphingomonas qomolangmaensis]|uniref:SMODS and SLOG-associating 2TM effector domain-containing protein n=1 Tax=Sphingomonas qomolangmaensis TaxID=2918765 RepID=A0ABY5L7T6_9SPHN|nr:hypothetical protein [Sphingomonas qomolangmaensis]UUL82221.1 hypothetical protein NMP03_13690 [Sphingomonas qomolangmaensis]
MTDRPKIADLNPAGLAFAQHNLEEDRKAYERLIARRDAIADKLRFGAIALNAGSLIALLSVMGGAATRESWIGLSTTHARWVAAAFVLGILVSGAGAVTEHWLVARSSGDAFARMKGAGSVLALHQANFDDETNAGLFEAITTYQELKLVEFQYSWWSICLQNISYGCWIFGALMIVDSVLS